MSRPNLESIEEMLKKSKKFTLTDEQYTKKTGIPMPRNKYYLLKDSALAKMAKKYGFSMVLTEKQIAFSKD